MLSIAHVALGIYESCSFVGKQPRIVDYLSVSDVLAIALRTGVVWTGSVRGDGLRGSGNCFACGRSPEVVTDGETGFLSEVGDVDKMANDAARLLTDNGLRLEMGRRARESAITRYRTDVVIPQYIDFYEKVIA